MRVRYSRWDGSQDLPDLDADDLLAEVADDVLSHGDLESALRRLLHQGVRPPGGRAAPGLRDLLQRLRRRRQEQLDRYDLGSSLEDITQQLEDILRTERDGMDRRLAEAREGARQGRVPEQLARQLEQVTTRNRQALDALPPDPAGRLRGRPAGSPQTRIGPPCAF